MIHTLWGLCVRYWPDLVLALLFAAIAESLRVGSRIREGWRWFKDKNAESSIANINLRITQQETFRNLLHSYLASDKLLYLAVLRNMTLILIFMCIAGLLLIIGTLFRAVEFPGAEFVALFALISAIAGGVYTMQLGSYDTSKISKLIEKIDTEILALKEARRELQTRRPGTSDS
jgi:hypothetical protein